MGGIFIAQDGKGLLIFALFDIAMCGEVTARGGSCDQILSGQQNEGSREIIIREMDLGEPKSI